MRNHKPSVSTEDIYAEVNARILGALAKGTAPWQRPWVGGFNAPRNLQSGKPYRGINALLLSMSDYGDPRWTTFAAAKKLGGMVRKGEKSTLVTLWKRIKIKDATAPNGEKIIAMLRYFRVFNVEQVTWPEGAIRPYEPETHPDGWDANVEAERILSDFLASENAPTLSYGGDSAFYMPAIHAMRLPDHEAFRSADGFYGTAFHESAHATGHESMLGRDLGGRFGSDPYAREELIAEMAAAMVCATIGVDGNFDNTAAYIKSWSARIAADPKLLVQAAGKAQKAADRIMGIEYTYEEAAPQTSPEAVAA